MITSSGQIDLRGKYLYLIEILDIIYLYYIIIHYLLFIIIILFIIIHNDDYL